MEGKRNAKEAASPRRNANRDEDVFDFPGVEDEGGGNGPVAREAYLALNEAFKSVKGRLLEANALNTELQTKLKQRDKKGPHGSVYQERDTLQSHLQKSYLAFEEKYDENEQLKKNIQELKEDLRLSQEAIAHSQGEGSSRAGSTSEEEQKSEKKRYVTITKELQTMGLEVVEEKEQLFVILTDRDNLKKWIEEKSDGNIKVAFIGSTLKDKATEIEGLLAVPKGYKELESKRNGLEAEVIQLKKKIQDQADELTRFYKVFKEVMELNKKAKVQQKVEPENTEQGQPQTVVSSGTSKRTTSRTSTALQKKAETMLATAKEQVAEIKKTKEHLDKQDKSLRTLIDLTEKTTQDFSRLVGAPKPREVPDFPGNRGRPQGAEGGEYMFQGHRSGEENFERAFSSDAPLSIAIQETEMHRLKNTGANVELSDEASYNLRLHSGESGMASSSAVFTRRTEGRVISMATGVSENTWTGESDIEVIEEEEDFVGASMPRGKICPVCERFFSASYGQNAFEMHVQEHFDDDA